MKKTALLLLTILIGSTVFAQRDWKKEKMEAQKVAFLTNELDLTPEEAQQFWPVYNQYSKELQENQRNRYKNINSIDIETISEERAKASIENHLKSEEVIVKMTSDYANQFFEILGFKRTLALFQAEVKFKKELLERIKNYDRRGSNRR